MICVFAEKFSGVYYHLLIVPSFLIYALLKILLGHVWFQMKVPVIRGINTELIR